MREGREDPAPRPSVLFVVTSLGTGGAQKQVVQLAAHMHRRGWPVRGVVSLLPIERKPVELTDRGIASYSLGVGTKANAVCAVARAIRLLRRLRPDVLVTFLFHATLVGGLARPWAGAPPMVSSIRGEGMAGSRRNLRFAIQRGMSRATVVNSRRVAMRIGGDHGRLPSDLHVIHNGIEPQNGRAGEPKLSRENLGLTERDFVWLAVGSLLPVKDYETLLRAFSALERRFRPKLLVAGDGPLREDLTKEIQRLRLESRVTLLGARRDVDDLLHLTDAFVMSSRSEGMPNALMEAMAAGKPVVATRVGGVEELVTQGQEGYLVEPGHADELAHAMTRLMSLPAGPREALGRTGQMRVVRDHGWDAVLSEWETAILRALTGAGRE